VTRAAALLAPGHALDIACGSGRHAVWLHQHGWKVTAVDRNADAIAQLRAAFPSIDARVIDLEADVSVIEPDTYDLVVCWLYHQPDLYPLIRAAVRPGGIVALCVLLEGRFAARPDELRSHFEGWTILHSGEWFSRHKAYEIIARFDP
jgi:SAM-dependent methyltransferase